MENAFKKVQIMIFYNKHRQTTLKYWFYSLLEIVKTISMLLLAPLSTPVLQVWN